MDWDYAEEENWEDKPEDEDAKDEDITKGFESLNNMDYCLNSPLIPEEMDEFCKYAQGLPSRTCWEGKIWNKNLEILREHPSVMISEIKTSNEFHRTFGQIAEEMRYMHRLFNKAYNKTEKDSRDTFIVPKVYFEAMGVKLNSTGEKGPMNEEVNKWGGLFLETHFITLLINSTEEELERLFQRFKKMGVNVTGRIISFQFFGQVLIMNGMAILIKYNQVCDRNFILMMKDVFVARMNTYLSLMGRVDGKYDRSSWLKISEIYQRGDSLLAKYGNKVYEGLKMLEPLCNLQLCSLARVYRPLIPDFPSFRTHLRNGVADKTRKWPEFAKFAEAIATIDNVNNAILVYGSYRHFGHPIIDYFTGLEKLHSNVTAEKEIDVEYAGKLASDLAFKVLKKFFLKEKKWYVDKEGVPEAHKFKEHIMENTWPTPKEVRDFGDQWHLLPLIKCFNLPPMIDPALLYSDKSHSMNRREVFDHLTRFPTMPINGKKVLQSFMDLPAQNWPEFLQRINDFGLTEDELIIGLRAKERELKGEGRFFALMSWSLREYFVITEYLIKEHFVPLFSGLTMADDLTTVIKKMMNNSAGQGLDNYDHICISNHIDYEKWNNHKRLESTGPVFKVMGQFLGYPMLIARTHEFFQKSIIYYAPRSDLIYVEGNELKNRTEKRVCWNGQAGGLEGLRQKGWSIIDLLLIARECLVTNAKVVVLAQGDNQIINCHYEVVAGLSEAEIVKRLLEIVRINDKILKSLENGINRMGFLINRDETMQSADYLNYGKIPIFRGNIKGLENKRWSRVTCVTNDQLPTLGNVMASVVTNSLTVSHFEDSPVNPIVMYNWFANFARSLVEFHDPALKGDLPTALNDQRILTNREYKIVAIYLDPLLGGVSGSSLNRFMVRMFPDPITESLSFWKIIHDHTTDKKLQGLCRSIGNPRISPFKLGDLRKLLENPMALNLVKGINAVTLVKEEIKKHLLDNSESIGNHIVRKAVQYMKAEEDRFLLFLYAITPLFPRFISEYRSSTYFGITEGILNLFQNSRTIRKVFKKKCSDRLNSVIPKSEITAIQSLLNLANSSSSHALWSCSSKQADYLRIRSWGKEVVGTTIPHPSELIGKLRQVIYDCEDCKTNFPHRVHLATVLPEGLVDWDVRRGKYSAYLGSKTSETTSIIRPWEKETTVPLIRRACDLRHVIWWFVMPDSILGRTIYQNLEALTGESWNVVIQGFRRTGSALHRFSCSRQDSGGYAACNPSKLTKMFTTTDAFAELGSENYDFMYQSLILYAEMVSGIRHENRECNGIYHHHISCQDCMRLIEEPLLDVPFEFVHADVSAIIKDWIPGEASMSEERPILKLSPLNWKKESGKEKTVHIGRAIGFVYGHLKLTADPHAEDSSLFPLALKGKIYPVEFMDGLVDGFFRAAAGNAVHRRKTENYEDLLAVTLGMAIYVADRICVNANFINFGRMPELQNLFMSIPHKIPPSYPLSNTDLGALARNYLRVIVNRVASLPQILLQSRKVIIFSDMVSLNLIGPFYLSQYVFDNLFLNRADFRNFARLSRYLSTNVRADVLTENERKIVEAIIQIVPEETRHAAQSICPSFVPRMEYKSMGWGEEVLGEVYKATVHYMSHPPEIVRQDIEIHKDPTISGLRLAQIATGAHYKVRPILLKEEIFVTNALVGGDGSGGLGALLLRMYPHARLIFNSLLVLDDVILKGASPTPPSAILAMGSLADNCVNLNDVWKHPSDLARSDTWDYFISVKRDLNLPIDFVLFDMEVRDLRMTGKIIDNLANYLSSLLEAGGVCVFKTYMHHLLNLEKNILTEVGLMFASVEVATTEFSSSRTSEVYVVMRGFSHHLRRLLKPDRSTIYAFAQKYCFALLPEEAEFQRARQVAQQDMLCGIPRSLIPDPKVDLFALLSTLGVETGTALRLSRGLGPNTRLNNDPVVTYLVSMNSLIPVSRGYAERIPPPPDTIVRALGCLFGGFAIWYSLQTNQYQIHHHTLKMITEHFPFNWGVRKYKKGLFQRWSLTNSFPLKKYVRITSQFARVAQVIRVWHRLFSKFEDLSSPDGIHDELQNYDKGLTIRSVLSSTNSLTSLTDKPIYLQDSSLILLSGESKKIKEAAWCE